MTGQFWPFGPHQVHAEFIKTVLFIHVQQCMTSWMASYIVCCNKHECRQYDRWLSWW